MVFRYSKRQVIPEPGMCPFDDMVRSPYGEYVECDDYAALEARVAELEKDAARYRWLRSNHAARNHAGVLVYVSGSLYTREALGDVIDEAMSREA